MSIEDQSIINPAVTKLEKLNGEPFSGYRSEVWDVIAEVVKQCRASEQGEGSKTVTQQAIAGSEDSTKISALQQEIYGIVPADRLYSREELLSYVKRAETSAIA